MDTTVMLLFIASTFFGISYGISTTQVHIKIVGIHSDSIALASNFNSFLLLINKVLISAGTLCFALSADIGFAGETLTAALLWFALLNILIHLLLVLFNNRICYIFHTLMGFYDESYKKKKLKDIQPTKQKALATPCFIMIVFLLGFTLPMLVISIFPEYRATIFQVSTIINGIGSILNVTIVERKLARLMDENDLVTSSSYGFSIVKSRLMATFLVGVSFLIVAINVN